MAKYAIFAPKAPEPKPVVGWIDTDSHYYRTLPPSGSRILLTDQQWAARLADPSGWVVDHGRLREK